MKYKNFLLRAVNLLLILGVLWQYQQVALVRAAAVSQRKQEIAEVEAYNASVLQAQSAAQAEQSQSGYRDGTYEGSAFGFGDVIRSCFPAKVKKATSLRKTRPTMSSVNSVTLLKRFFEKRISNSNNLFFLHIASDLQKNVAF